MPASFDQLYARAADRHGGSKALESQLPVPKSREALAAIPDERWLSEMTRRVFQAGFNWSVVDTKWPGFEAAFEGFDVHRCAMLSDDDLDRLLSDPRIVRNGVKIRSVRENAAFLLDLAAAHGSAARVFADWPSENFAGLLDLLKAKGARLGGLAGAIALRNLGKDSFLLSGDVVAALKREGVIDGPPGSRRSMQAIQAAFNGWMAESGRGLTQISRVLALGVGEKGAPRTE
ncbi:DNA-3-methyladenine glycosylase I [Thalassobaculum sp.]|uniref:DNA-3-methyladenine glycosylase I n=1 Tax=Thalassobaculum sp. TaxID=2022740 RepID=UPI0032EAB255